MQFGIFRIDLNAVMNFFASNSAAHIVTVLFALAGWVVAVWLLLHAGTFFLAEYKEGKYKANWQWVLLAVDIPPLNVQTPKAVEQMFAHLTGAFYQPDIADKFRTGYKQRWFSFEIISLEGYIQFLVRTEVKFRDLVEAAIYAQYPEAEIVEVEDYVARMPDQYPNGEYDLWAADFGLAETDGFPIRTYREFEHSISKDTVLKDPMGTLLESFTRIGPGEQMWFQILVEPIASSWKEKSIKKINEIISAKSKGGEGGLLSALTDNIVTEEIGRGLAEINAQLTGGEAAEAAVGGKEERVEPNLVRYLTPGQAKLVESMETKIEKLGFKTKMRGIYVARQEVFRPERGVNALVGAMNQFNIPSANSIVPKLKVETSYFFHEWRTNYRKRLLMQAYKKRKIKSGGNPFILNIEELATVWHFPMSHVKTPLVQKAAGKRGEPPAGLPVESVAQGPFASGQMSKVGEGEPADQPGRFVTDAGDVGYSGEARFG